MTSVSLGDALFTKTQQRVLALLYGRPDKRLYTNEIVRLADMGRGTVMRELDRLVAAGVLAVSKEGNQRHYQANPGCPIYPEILGIVRKTFGVADVLRKALAPLDSRIELAFVYGSMAKAADTQDSDIDLMLVGHDLSYADVVELLIPVEDSLHRSINPTIYTPEEYREKISTQNSFLVRVMEQPKLMIKGVIDDFGKPGQDQPAEERATGQA